MVACHERRLLVRAEPGAKGRELALPWGWPAKDDSLDTMAERIARRATGGVPEWMEQIGAFADSSAHPGGSGLSVAYAAVMPWSETPLWRDTRALSSLGTRQRRMVNAALATMRSRLEQAPVAFSLLPPEFTLSELQQAYETLLGRRLHKASFRRALQAAFLVQPTNEWRSEGRGRPAQLFRYAPRKRKTNRRGVRLDLL
jgi:ADP-ribose pyrophosphatase YjhB (NUDIX family)